MSKKISELKLATSVGEECYIPIVVDGTTMRVMVKVLKENLTGEPGEDGKDGTSPTISITKITGGNRVTIKDVEGTKYFDVMDGSDGKDGDPGSPGSDGNDGEDGVGIKSIEQTTASTVDGGENVSTITLTNGQIATFKVKNGTKGSQGDPGKDGSDASVTLENIVKALEYTPAKQSDVNDLSEEIADLKAGITLGEHTDGLIYIFVNGVPTGVGVEMGTTGEIIGVLDENNNIILTGDLPDGTYVFKYESTNGTYADIGNLVIGGVVQYSITATLTECTAVSGNAEMINEGETVTLKYVAKDGFALTDTVSVSGASYTWDSATGTLVLSNPTADVTVSITAIKSGVTNIIDTIGYEDNMRLSSSGTTKAETGFVSTGMIDISAYADPTVIRTDGVNFNYNGYCYLVVYDAAGNKTGYNTLTAIISGGTTWSGFTVTSDADGNIEITSTTAASNYFRISGYGSGADLIVTINEEITK